MPITPQQIQAAEAVQHRAAHDRSDQIRLVAGPGTGKSFAIEERVCWLISNAVNPDNIFVVSFTRAAARDLKSRIHAFCSSKGVTNSARVSVTTLHSLALRTLRAAGLLAYPSSPVVMDRWELKNIFDREFSKVSALPPSRCEKIRHYYEAFWNTGQWGPPNYMPPNPPISTAERRDFRFFHGPRTQTYSCVSPGEIVRQCLRHIATQTLDPVTLLNIDHLIVDEFQDLNPSDLDFVDHIIQRGAITFVAGDDDQSIYSFRFASPAGIQGFIGKYPFARNHILTQSFRCTPSIIQAAVSLIRAHPVPNRIPKTLNSLYAYANPPLQGHLFRWRFPDGVQEAQSIAESCRDLIQAGISPRDIRILLSNTDLLLRYQINALDALQLPYERPHANEYIYSSEGRLALTFLRIACNQNDYVAHRTLFEFCPGVGISTCDDIADAVVHNNLNFRHLFYRPLPGGVFGRRELNALNFARQICTQLSAWQPTDTLSQRGTDIENLLNPILGNVAQQAWIDATSHLPVDITLEELKDYLWADTDEQEVRILNEVYQRLGQPIPQQGAIPQKIQIMTMHGVKGLNAKVVFIPGLEEQVFPGQWRTPYPGLVLEAARLLFVSITRARAACILSYAASRMIYGRIRRLAPSRFTTHVGGDSALDEGFHNRKSELLSVSLTFYRS